MTYSSNPRLTKNSQSLRKNMTKEERTLWYQFLRLLSIPFHRQKTIGVYIVDFYCDKAKLIIELDGSQHFEDTGVAQDQQRDADLRGMGYTILRYANSDVNRNLRGAERAHYAQLRRSQGQSNFNDSRRESRRKYCKIPE